MISIIIPAYNRQNYIEQCVQSALNQSYEDLEVIIIDDGSVDTTGSICDSLAATDARIRVIHQENGGVSAARQAGIDIACGEWICFLDSDDTLPENALAKYTTHFKENPDIIVSGYSGVLDKKSFRLGITDYSINPALWGKLFKADFLKANMPLLPRELVMGEDMIANLVLGLKAEKIATIKDIQYNVTLDNSTSVMKTFKNSFEYENFFFSKFEELFLSNCHSLPYFPELERNATFLKLNGYKNVILCGNDIDTTSNEWKDFLSKIHSCGLSLGPSDKLFLMMQHCQTAYRTVMNLYLQFLK